MHEKDRIIITSGTFDPLSIEELRFLKKCKARGDWLVVGVHSDWWMAWSEGGYVQDYAARREIVSNINCVDEIFSFNDSDGTIIQLLKLEARDDVKRTISLELLIIVFCFGFINADHNL
jgi:glycerol-3-phosphate cytidylyltransferase-like family protein